MCRTAARSITPPVAATPTVTSLSAASRIRIIEADIAAGAVGNALRAGVHVLPATTGMAWADGSQLYWNASGKLLTTSATGNTKAGIAIGAKASAAATANFLLNGNCA